MLALIDSDILLYTIGFTTEDKEEAVAFARLDEFIANILLACGADDYICFLSDSKENNFRYKIDPSYKANRVQPKPKHYEVLKEYLLVEHKAKIAHGMEADDAMGIAQDKNWDGAPTTVICTIDKDLNQIPGLHYSWPILRNGAEIREGKLFLTNPDEGALFFWRQMLIGDTADNIKGIDGIGKVRAEALLTPYMFEDEMYHVVWEKYQDQWGDDAGEKFLNNKNLLYIKRENEEQAE